MANVIKTVLTYPINGSTRDFNIPFEYLARKFIVVTLLGKDRRVLTLNTDYRFATRTTISTTKAWGPADGYTMIELRRVTSATERLVDFTDGSILRAYDLNVAQIQTMHVAEEARDLTADTIGVNNDGHLDARNRRIVNLADAVNPRDAVPLGQIQAINQNAWQARNEAQGFRNEAQTFRNQAEQFKNQAQGFRNEAETFKNQAGTSATNAKASETSALNSKNAASGSATAASNSANAAKTSETNAATYEVNARKEADRAKIEADKLGNWNQLAGTVDSVNGINVTFKGIVGALGEFRSASANGLRIVQGEYGTIFRQDGASTYIMTTNRGDKWGSYSSLRPVRIDNADGSVWFGHGTYSNKYSIDRQAFFVKNMVKLGNENFPDRSVNMRIWGASGRNNVCEWGDENGWMMYIQRREWNTNTGANIQLSINGQIVCQGGAMTQQLKLQNGHALKLESDANKAHYILSSDGTRNNWYLGRGSDNSNVVGFHSYVMNTSLFLREDRIGINKMIKFEGGGTGVFAQDGNINGAKWGGKWLDVYIRDNYIAKKKAWTQVWAASGGGYMAGGQQTGTLSQDLRFRNIWIKTRSNSWNFFRTGPDGIYFIAADGGWLRFQIHSGGKVFKNVADRDAPPTAIVVENE